MNKWRRAFKGIKATRIWQLMIDGIERGPLTDAFK